MGITRVRCGESFPSCSILWNGRVAFLLTISVCEIRGRALQTSTHSLSHEFYQVLVGDPRMGIHGWKQLALWSLEHACLEAGEIEHAKEIFGKQWETFCEWVVEKFGEFAGGLEEIDGV